MTDREFRDNALIAVTASIAAVQEPSPNQFTPGSYLLPSEAVASRAANIVAALIEQRKAMEAKK